MESRSQGMSLWCGTGGAVVWLVFKLFIFSPLCAFDIGFLFYYMIMDFEVMLVEITRRYAGGGIVS